jgi:hypothetical protein
MKNPFILILLILLSIAIAYSQDSVVTNHKNDSIIKASEKNFIKQSKEQTAIFISLKGGYQTINPYYEGLKKNTLINISAGFLIKNHFYIGAYYDNNIPAESNVIYAGRNLNREYSGYKILLSVKYYHSFFKQKFEVNSGIGIGGSDFKYNDIIFNNYRDGFITFEINFGLGYKINKILSIDLSASYDYLFQFWFSHYYHEISLLNIKLGPTIYLYY